jgi:hypothetical protein
VDLCGIAQLVNREGFESGTGGCSIGRILGPGPQSLMGPGPVLGFGALSPSGVGLVSFSPVVQRLPRTAPASHAFSPSGVERIHGGGRVGVGQERPVQRERFRA